MRRVLTVDAVACAGMALLLLVFAGWAAPHLGLSPDLLRGGGIVLVPWTAFLVFALAQSAISRSLVMAVIVGNLAWVAASLGLLVSGRVDPTVLGTVFVLLQAAVVLVLTWVQVNGRSRLP